jgi:hypothetical protein
VPQVIGVIAAGVAAVTAELKLGTREQPDSEQGDGERRVPEDRERQGN